MKEMTRRKPLSLDDEMCHQAQEETILALESIEAFAESVTEHQGTMAQDIFDQKLKVRRNPVLKWDEDVVSVIVRGLPRCMTQLTFLHMLNQEFANTYDFLFLPHCEKNRWTVGVGFGFVSFRHPRVSQAFKAAFEGKTLTGSRRPMSINTAALQGFDANYRHFSAIRNVTKNDPQLCPLFFRHGQPLDTAAELALQVDLRDARCRCFRGFQHQ